jgi:hypothetical protein
MAVPAVSVGSHERYGPEIRDRILAKLQAPADRTSYQMLTPARLRALVDIESPRAPVVSFYLQLSPHRRVRRVWHAAFNSHASATLKRVASRREREALKEEIDRIEGALRAGLPALGRGVAFFTCEAVGLWQQIAVAVPLTDGVHLGPRPHIRPLVRTRDEHDRFVLALLSLEHSRFFISQIGQVQEVLQVKGQSLKRVLTERALRDRGDVLDSEAARNEARLLAHAAELVLAQFEAAICRSPARRSCARPSAGICPRLCASDSTASLPSRSMAGHRRSQRPLRLRKAQSRSTRKWPRCSG